MTFAGVPAPEVTWESATKLTCITPAASGSGPVIVATRSGDTGTCTVEFFFEPVVEEEPEPEEIDRFTEARQAGARLARPAP